VTKKKKKKTVKPKAQTPPKVQKKWDMKFGEGDEFTDLELYGDDSDEDLYGPTSPETVLNADLPPSIPETNPHEADPQLVEEEKAAAEESEYEYGEESEDEHKKKEAQSILVLMVRNYN
jgi:hypothetical protein